MLMQFQKLPPETHTHSLHFSSTLPSKGLSVICNVVSIHLITLICQLTDELCKEAEADDAVSVQFAERGGVAGFSRSAAPECAASSKVCHSVLSADGDGDDANLPPRTEEAKRKKNFTNPHYTITHKSEVLKVKK